MSQQSEAISEGMYSFGQRVSRIDRSMSKTQAMIDDVSAQIEAGVLSPVDKLPAGAELCRQYDVSGVVVRGAIQ